MELCQHEGFGGIKDDIIVTTPQKEWYYPNGDFDTYGIPEKW